MNKDIACKILNIPIDYDEPLLRKKYKIACLKYHPDKNISYLQEGVKNHNDFIEVKEAYDFLLRDNRGISNKLHAISLFIIFIL